MLTAGVDIGSRSSKAIILKDGEVVGSGLNLASHVSVAERGLEVLATALKDTPYSQEDLDFVVATGYGRISAPYADNTITEITCHAKGMHSLVPSVRTIIDIGGQDSKVIKLNEAGEVVDFAMNDRCAAGTGKFLEVTAKAMKLSLEDFSKLYFDSTTPKSISSMCTVFAESEVVSLLADNIPSKDIVAGLIQAVARRVGTMAKRLGVVEDFLFTGGVAKNLGVRKALESATGHNFISFEFDPQLVGALGAAVLAGEQNEADSVKKKARTLQSTARLHILLEERPEEIVSLRKEGKKTVGFFCAYVPEEIIHALDLVPLRLIRGGSSEASNAGNAYLSSNACPYAASCVGLKEEGKDFYFSNADVIADAPSCYQMKRVMEVWEEYFDAKVIHIGLPRTFYEPKGVRFFAVNLEHFVKELEEVSGNKLTEERLRKSVNLFNDIREKQKKLYELLRIGKVAWSEVIQFMHGGLILDSSAYLELLKELITELEADKTYKTEQPIRILLTGSMLAPGDHKLLEILDELGIECAMDELCAGSRGTFREVKDISVEGLAESYLDNVPCGAFPYPYPDKDPRQLHLEKLIQDYRIQGVMHYTLRFCDAYSYKAKSMREMCERANIPILHLHSDYSKSDKGQLKTRVEAFKESIQKQLETV